MTLQEYLEHQCSYLHTIIPSVPPGGDLSAVLSYSKGDNIGYLPANFDLFGKDEIINLFKDLLKEIEADQYSIICAAWYVISVNPDDVALIKEFGTSVMPDIRKECYWVVAGDKTGSIMASFDVDRNEAGKIQKLIRRSEEIGFTTGRMYDLMAEAKH